MKKRVLVFPCGSEIGLEIYNSVKNSTQFELIGLNSISDHGKFVYENYIEGIDFVNHPNFLNQLNTIIDSNKIDILYPTMDHVISFLLKNEKEINIPIVGPSSEIASLCASKKNTYSFFQNHIRVPKTFSKEDSNLPFPLFLKPDIGYGSRNVIKIENEKQLEDKNLSENILCEYLPGDEYTIDCFTDLNGELIFTGARQRKRVSNGISVNTKTSKQLTNEFETLAKKINSLITFKGSWFFQIKKDSENKPCLLEIACRFAGSSSVHRIQGINFALANLYLTIGINPIFIQNNIEIELDRALNNKFKIDFFYDKIFIDYDDTIIVNNKLNLEAIKLIYNCHNHNKSIYLITKHIGNLQDSLKSFKIENIFTHIIHINKDEEESNYIKNFDFSNSIFIDDSFSERKKISKSLKIPVFSTDSIESLIY